MLDVPYVSAARGLVPVLRNLRESHRASHVLYVPFRPLGCSALRCMVAEADAAVMGRGSRVMVALAGRVFGVTACWRSAGRIAAVFLLECSRNSMLYERS